MGLSEARELWQSKSHHDQEQGGRFDPIDSLG